MGRFERFDGSAWTTEESGAFPDDFSTDEAEFASELRELFAPDREDLPPLYVQTLIEDSRHSAVEPGYEQKLAYRVFRRLHLPRTPLFERRRGPFATMRTALTQVSRPVAASFSALLVFMLVTVVMATPSFANGMRLLLSHTGVEQVKSYPTGVQPSKRHVSATRTPRANTLDPSIPISWLGFEAENYTYQGTRLQDAPEWSQGPIVDLQYTLVGPAKGSGLLDIREFQVSDQYSAVLQVVASGAATLVQVGNVPAIYVDGTWVPQAQRGMLSVSTEARPPYTWQGGTHSELIYERGGVVFWIVGDQRDGMGQDALVRMAQHLVPIDRQALQLDRVSLRLAGETLLAQFREPAGSELYKLIPRGASPDSGSGAIVGPESTGTITK